MGARGLQHRGHGGGCRRGGRSCAALPPPPAPRERRPCCSARARASAALASSLPWLLRGRSRCRRRVGGRGGRARAHARPPALAPRLVRARGCRGSSEGASRGDAGLSGRRALSIILASPALAQVPVAVSGVWAARPITRASGRHRSAPAGPCGAAPARRSSRPAAALVKRCAATPPAARCGRRRGAAGVRVRPAAGATAARRRRRRGPGAAQVCSARCRAPLPPLPNAHVRLHAVQGCGSRCGGRAGARCCGRRGCRPRLELIPPGHPCARAHARPPAACSAPAAPAPASLRASTAGVGTRLPAAARPPGLERGAPATARFSSWPSALRKSLPQRWNAARPGLSALSSAAVTCQRRSYRARAS